MKNLKFQDSTIVRFNKRLNYVFAMFGIVVCSGLVLMTVLDIILRRFFNEPLSFSFEITQLALSLIVFSFVPYATMNLRHVSIEVLVQTFPRGIRKWADITGDLLTGILFGFICWQCYLKGLQIREFGYMTGELEIPLFPFYFFISIGSLLSCISLLLKVILFIISKIQRGS